MARMNVFRDSETTVNSSVEGSRISPGSLDSGVGDSALAKELVGPSFRTCHRFK